jgi:hypothetical protein
MNLEFCDIAISNFFKGSRKPEGFYESYDDKTLIEAVMRNFEFAKPGYRDGVILVPIEVKQIRTSVVEITPDMEIVSTYESRVEGETPRKRTYVLVDELPLAKSVSVVLYSYEVLAEDNDRSSEADWEIIAVLAHTTDEAEPMTPSTLMANHFKADGGTATNMASEEFEAALRKSYNFWKNHMLAEVRGKNPVRDSDLKNMFLDALKEVVKDADTEEHGRMRAGTEVNVRSIVETYS